VVQRMVEAARREVNAFPPSICVEISARAGWCQGNSKVDER